MKKFLLRFSSGILALLLTALCLPLFTFAADKNTFYRDTVLAHYKESFEISPYYHNLLDETRFLYKDWAATVKDKGVFTKGYLWSVQFMMGKNLNTNAYVDYLSNLLGMMEKGFSETAAAQAAYTAKLGLGDYVDGVLSIAFSDVLGGRFEDLKDAYELISDSKKLSDLGGEMITDMNQLSVVAASSVVYEQKITVLEAIRDNTSDSYLKEAAEDLIRVCDLQYIYIFDNYATDMGMAVSKLDYDLLDYKTFENILPTIQDTVEDKFIPWLTDKIGEKAGDIAKGALKYAGVFIKKFGLFTCGFSIGIDIMKLIAGNQSEYYREMLAMDAISDALFPAFREVKKAADAAADPDTKFGYIQEFEAIGKMLLYTHLRGDYCNVECRFAGKEEGADEYYDYLIDNLGAYEEVLSGILLPENLFVVNDQFELYNGFIKEIMPKTTVPEGYTPIYTFADFAVIAENNPTGRQMLNQYNKANYILMADIVCPAEYETATAFAGIFDGNGYTISNISKPLFYCITGSTVKNLGLEVNYYHDYEEGEPAYGALAQASACYFYSSRFDDMNTVDNCFVKGAITVKGRCVKVGGLIGDGYAANITNCYSEADISAQGRQTSGAGGITGGDGHMMNCFNTGDIDLYVSGDNTWNAYSIDVYAGGITGKRGAYTEIQYCYNTGSVTAGAGISCEVSAGGIAGTAVNGCDIRNCFNLGKIRVYENYAAAGRPGQYEEEHGNEILFGATYYAGGIIGNMGAGGTFRSIIENCWNGGTVQGRRVTGGITGRAYSECEIVNCFNVGSLTGEKTVGGICGDFLCYDKYPTVLSCCYNAGVIVGGEKKGALVGEMYDGNMEPANCEGEHFFSCYYLELDLPPVTNGVTVNTTALSQEAMEKAESFVGFDFLKIWVMKEDGSIKTPALRFKSQEKD